METLTGKDRLTRKHIHKKAEREAAKMVFVSSMPMRRGHDLDQAHDRPCAAFTVAHPRLLHEGGGHDHGHDVRLIQTLVVATNVGHLRHQMCLPLFDEVPPDIMLFLAPNALYRMNSRIVV